MAIKFEKLKKTIVKCNKCPRLVKFRKKISTEKRKQKVKETNDQLSMLLSLTVFLIGSLVHHHLERVDHFLLSVLLTRSESGSVQRLEQMDVRLDPDQLHHLDFVLFEQDIVGCED